MNGRFLSVEIVAFGGNEMSLIYFGINVNDPGGNSHHEPCSMIARYCGPGLTSQRRPTPLDPCATVCVPVSVQVPTCPKIVQDCSSANWAHGTKVTRVRRATLLDPCATACVVLPKDNVPVEAGSPLTTLLFLLLIGAAIMVVK